MCPPNPHLEKDLIATARRVGGYSAVPAPTLPASTASALAPAGLQAHTKAEVEVAIAGPVDVAATGRTTAPRIEEPAAAANNAGPVAFFRFPGSSIIRRAFVIIMPMIQTPFPNITMHVEKIPLVGPFQTHGMGRLLRIFLIPGIIPEQFLQVAKIEPGLAPGTA